MAYKTKVYIQLREIYMFKMVDFKSKDFDASVRVTEEQNIYDALKENFIRTVDEWAKNSTTIFTINFEFAIRFYSDSKEHHSERYFFTKTDNRRLEFAHA